MNRRVTIFSLILALSAACSLSMLSISLKALRRPGLILSTPDSSATVTMTLAVTLTPTATGAIVLTNRAGTPFTNVDVQSTATALAQLLMVRGASAYMLDANELGAECVRLMHSYMDASVYVGGWTISDESGYALGVPNISLQPFEHFTICAGSGQDTPNVIYLGLNEEIWQPGEQIILRDRYGNIQSTNNAP